MIKKNLFLFIVIQAPIIFCSYRKFDNDTTYLFNKKLKNKLCTKKRFFVNIIKFFVYEDKILCWIKKIFYNIIHNNKFFWQNKKILYNIITIFLNI